MGLRAYLVRPLFLLVLVAVVATLLALFLRSDLGLAMRATGANPRMARAQGIRVGVHIMAGVALSNALVALAGALFAQTNGFADVTSGIGTIVVGLAAVIVGETLLPWRGIFFAVVACVLGSVLYRLAVQLALNLDFLGLTASDLNLATALLVLFTLILPRLRNRQARRHDRRREPFRLLQPGHAARAAGAEEALAHHPGKASSARSSARTAPASRRCSRRSPATCLPEAGRIVLSGRDVTRLPAERRAGRVARVFQDPLAGSCAELTIAENLALAARRGQWRGLGDALGKRRDANHLRARRRARHRPGEAARAADGLALRRPAAGAGAGHGDARALRDRAARRAHRGARSGQRRVRAAADRRRSPAASA